MVRKVLIRLALSISLVALVLALGAATGGSAGVGFVTTTPYLSTDGNNVQCPGFGVNERHYCLLVTTYNNFKKSGGVQLDLQLQNFDQSALTNPATVVTWDNTNAKLSFVSSSGPSNCSSPSAGEVDCRFPNIAGLGSAAGANATPNTSSVKLFFSADSSGDPVSFKAVANAKESGNDSGGAANVESQTVDPAVMNFDTNANADATVVLPINGFNKPHLHTTIGNAFLDFTSSSPAFIAQFAATNGVECLLGVSCTGLDLNTDLSGATSGTFSANNQILWTAEVPSNSTNISAVHTYDPVSITATTPSTLTTPGTTFANCDGVSFVTAPTGLTPGVYFVRNATASGGNTTFQVSTAATGKVSSFTQSGMFSGSCIRVIGGKDKSEIVGPCSATSAPPQPAVPPALCVVKLSNTTVKAYLWDSANGHVGY
jgi:hypothetical protein